MELTKEEIQTFIEGIKYVINDFQYFGETYRSSKEKINDLLQQLQLAKSIQDLQKEAFEAGRKHRLKNTYEFESFEDYLKSKENGTTIS